MDEMLARLERIYPNGRYVLIPKYIPEQWAGRDYDSKFDQKNALNRWNSKPLSYDEAQEKCNEGYRIGWVVPEGMCVVDIDNSDHPDSEQKILRILEKFEVKYSYNKTSRGIHLLFQDANKNIKSDSHCKCGLNIDIDTRANRTGYIILPCNDPHRKWGKWTDFVEEIPYFLKPLMRDNTQTFIGMSEGDGRNTALFKWRGKLIQSHKLNDKEIENTIRTINEYIFETAMPNSELFKTVLRDLDDVAQNQDKVEKKNVFNEIANDIVSKFDIISFGDNFYKFNGTYYESIDQIDLERIIHFDVSCNISSTGRKEIIQFLRIKTQVKPDEFDKDWYKIAVKNGILNVITGEVTTPTKTDINTIYVPWNYNPDPVYSPRIDQFMKDLTGGDFIKMQFLYQIAGYALLKRNVFEKFFIFQGDGGTGKSTYMNIVQKMIGDDSNTSHVSLADFDKDYYLATLIGKILNIDDDVVDGKTLENTGRFKSIISGNKISVRQIYQPVITFAPYATLMFSCNKLPRIMDKTAGLYRRLILVELNNKVGKPDPLFMLKLTDADMEYFLFKAVEGVKQALEEGHLRYNISEQELLRKFRCRQSPLNEWLYENNMTLGDFVDKRCLAMYNIFTSWAQENGYNKLPAMYTFKEDVCALYDCEVENVQEQNGANVQHFVKHGSNINLTLKPF